MPFPDSRRVIYKRNPLAEVICQLRFPPILRIDSEAPSRFQEAIRNDYPLYGEAPEMTMVLPPNVPPEIAKLIQGLRPTFGAGKRHVFTTEDRNWEATLTRESLALKTTVYRRWEDFRQRLTILCEALVLAYQPSFFVRIGLRYVDVILRSTLDLASTPWSQLLQPHLAGELSSPEIAEDIETAQRQVLVKLDAQGGRVMIRHGLAVAEPAHEGCFFVDSDFHTERRTELKDANKTLDNFNRAAGCLFRWCIRERLHLALQPESVSE